ncbi:carbohydrate kinase [Halalkalibacter sp. APA_J-10(15)]|uniref:carbohydrate kinase family protein n=1 Tax=Halalkalibacter sp. APA_J-10(15) TaxID=2933805 RepID=UPI001FF28961|nr:carbohydrate kinase [Halalkalibacter sp. APA_J-10(15)]MCK0473267.1 carbohydrate kinase [Halalkalibacter sp. APA_J-10(15)]
MQTHSTIVCIGELLIDFFCTDTGNDLIKGMKFEKQAGGAPANVCASIVKLGGHALICGKVGNDPFGHFLKNTLEELKVDTSMLVFDDTNPTTLAFVALQENGEREFVFNRGADAFLTEEDLDMGKIDSARILHFGSATALLNGPIQTIYLNTMKEAKLADQFISFDPNFRTDLWKGNEQEFVALAKKAITFSDFVKVSEEELQLITGVEDIAEGVQAFHRDGAKFVAVTLGGKGTFISNGMTQETISSIKVKAIDTTGAGDAFVGAMLYQLAKEKEPKRVLENIEQIREITLFSNKVAALTCTKVGSIAAIPTMDDLNYF